MKRGRAGLLLFLFGTSLANAAPPPELPVETFQADMDFTDLQISPDGKYVVAIAPLKGWHNLFATELETRKAQWLTKFGDRDVISFNWVNDQRVVLTMAAKGFDMGGLFAIDRNGANDRVLVDVMRGQAQGIALGIRHVTLLDTLANDPDFILVETEEWDKFSTTQLRPPCHVDRMNVMNGNFTRLVQNPGNVISWTPDHNGDIRAAVALQDNKLRLLHRARQQDEWTTLAESAVGEVDLWPLWFTADNTNLYVLARNGKDTEGVYIYDPSQRKLVQCLWHNDQYDFGDLIATPDDREVMAVTYDADRLRTDWANSEWRALQAGIDRALTNAVNRFVNASRDGTKAVFLSFSDRNPGTYYLFDTRKRQMEFLANRASRIKPELMAETKPITYSARDGLTIHGYLTLPAGRSGTNLPLVAMPHGGPWFRDTWEFDPDVQFLANRGYAVLQMNFRGSTGYGHAHFKAGFKQWGLKMQDDVTDGVRWAIDQGIADCQRIAIYGASYGGYVVMTALTQTPELFRCGVNYVGVTDLPSLLTSGVIYYPRFEIYRSVMLGDLKTERAKLEAQSPLNHVEKIRAPVFLAYGGKDRIVHVAQGRRLARELKKHDKKFELVVEEQEGHGFHTEEKRIALFKKIDAFLKENLR